MALRVIFSRDPAAQGALMDHLLHSTIVLVGGVEPRNGKFILKVVDGASILLGARSEQRCTTEVLMSIYPA